jgi:hypothetical protein
LKYSDELFIKGHSLLLQKIDGDKLAVENA